jgi:hypothetical protein
MASAHTTTREETSIEISEVLTRLFYTFLMVKTAHWLLGFELCAKMCSSWIVCGFSNMYKKWSFQLTSGLPGCKWPKRSYLTLTPFVDAVRVLWIVANNQIVWLSKNDSRWKRISFGSLLSTDPCDLLELRDDVMIYQMSFLFSTRKQRWLCGLQCDTNAIFVTEPPFVT